MDAREILAELGAKPSISEENGLAYMRDTDLMVFSPGMSTAGFAESRMAQRNPRVKVIATTIDEEGLAFADEVIQELKLQDQIETRLEDLRDAWPYANNIFDYIYARLVLHYLSFGDLDNVLTSFAHSLKQGGRLFVVVRSEKNIDRSDPTIVYDEQTHFTTQSYYDDKGEPAFTSTRYFHTPESITEHLQRAGFEILESKEYQEQLYKDFMRKEISPVQDHVIEVLAKKK